MMSTKDYIVIRPDVCHGQPCFKDTRIMIYLVLEMLEGGESFDDIVRAYPALTYDHIRAAIHYAAEVIKTGEFMQLN
jgi:uncharacterized protein (DUF433 family)